MSSSYTSGMKVFTRFYIIFKRVFTRFINYFNCDNAVCRTAQTTPGLSKMSSFYNEIPVVGFGVFKYLTDPV